ncbi:hypothetical protein BV25DRAFT_142603 [Artomyces pyxidatus]|uniref:Uncharacterized protein n=1 Tax=Artomyces pyxidatus TaxID=48021 RepID=A0ACB8T990_9AGAM|nr:hypothetical protein BV25DRAFT_142603 [Artomyces pyxidatus]
MRLVAYRPFLAQATNTVLSQQTPVENPPYDAQNMKYAVAVPSGTNASMRLSIMVAIFFVSLFAASFPTLSKRVRYLNIPRVVFFLGKHFGTGVILSTAFVHLLQDAFESLLDPKVQEETSVGHWAGLIMCVSPRCSIALHLRCLGTLA